jgi:hypothetical protein
LALIAWNFEQAAHGADTFSQLEDASEAINSVGAGGVDYLPPLLSNIWISPVKESDHWGDRRSHAG